VQGTLGKKSGVPKLLEAKIEKEVERGGGVLPEKGELLGTLLPGAVEQKMEGTSGRSPQTEQPPGSLLGGLVLRTGSKRIG